jgi:uncharacterized damage-inducible protein DinB
MIDTLRHHLNYTEWASRRLIDAAAALSPEELSRDFCTADRCVIDTLAHVFAADRMWLSRVQGVPRATFIDAEDRSLASVQENWPPVFRAWQALIDGETEESVSRKIAYRDLKGNPWQTPLWQIILHMVNHGTHHRGQVTGFFRMMGHTPPPLDLIVYYRTLP